MRDAVSACAFAAGIAVCLLIVLPVTIDRSISVFMLTQMAAQPDHAFTPSELRSLFVDVYVERYGQIERRLEEQKVSRNVAQSAKRLPDHAARTGFCSVCASSCRSSFRPIGVSSRLRPPALIRGSQLSAEPIFQFLKVSMHRGDRSNGDNAPTLPSPRAHCGDSEMNLRERSSHGGYFSGCPIVTFSVPTPSISQSILSPATVAATPDGVPVRMMSPAASSTISDSLEMTSGTFQII